MQISATPSFWQRIKIIGPGFIWAAAAIGSGELIIASKVGSEYGLVFVWALWLGIWLKYWIQKGILDVTILTGKPIVELWHASTYGRVSSWYWLLFFILTATGVAGLLGLSASIMAALIPIASVDMWAITLTVILIALAYFQKYGSFERTMLLFCAVLAVGVAATAFISHPTPTELFAWDIPTTTAAALVFLSLLGWGAGSGPDLMLPYSWWVTEKGYQNLPLNSATGKSLAEHTDADSVVQVRSWLSLAKWDTAFGYVAAGVVATVFMIAGAKILAPRGIHVEGMSALSNLAAIFTETFGGWSFYLFMVPAFAAIYSTALGVFDGGRISIAHIVRMLLRKPTVASPDMRANIWYRVTLIFFSLVPLAIFLGFKQPVALVITAAVISAVSMPLLAFQVYGSLMRDIPLIYRPNRFYLGNLLLSVAVYLFFMGQALWQLTDKWWF
ncbi:MAG: Nramp family divalent metal transporter [Minisyncoccota bacterium]